MGLLELCPCSDEIVEFTEKELEKALEHEIDALTDVTQSNLHHDVLQDPVIIRLDRATSETSIEASWMCVCGGGALIVVRYRVFFTG